MRICEVTLGACLERIRICLRILDRPNQLDEAPREGNTTIHDDDLKILILEAKRLERGTRTIFVNSASQFRCNGQGLSDRPHSGWCRAFKSRCQSSLIRRALGTPDQPRLLASFSSWIRLEQGRCQALQRAVATESTSFNNQEGQTLTFSIFWVDPNDHLSRHSIG